jgi:threonylcarbamoyladenosine tRNA methylthiotransferase MtaB
MGSFRYHVSVPTAQIHTLGCKVNQADSRELAARLRARGLEIGGAGPPDVVVVNTCAVTATADAKARKLVRRLAREHPEAVLVVTGCGAQAGTTDFGRLPGVTAVVPGSDRESLADQVAGMLGIDTAIAVGEDAVREARATAWTADRTRAFLKVQDGCDHGCSYCIVPRARGPMRSRPREEALTELRGLAEIGIPEVVLVGIRLGAYGVDRGDTRLADLVRATKEVSIPRLRLSSIEPLDVTEELISALADHPTLCHHLHLPLQSGDDGILRDMARGYTASDYVELARRLRRAWPDLSLTTDLLVGFPGESEAAFGRSCAMVREMGFTRVHVFPYSRRPGTPAATRPDQVPDPVKKDRCQRLIGVGEESAAAVAKGFIGRPAAVLFETHEDGRGVGFTSHYLRAAVPTAVDLRGRLAAVTVEGAEGAMLLGHLKNREERPGGDEG